MSEWHDSDWAQWLRGLEREAGELAQMTEAFAKWAAEQKVLERFTEDQAVDLVRAFAAGCMYALDAQEPRGGPRA